MLSVRVATRILTFFILILGLDVARGQATNSCVSPLNDESKSKYAIVEVGLFVQTNEDGAFPAGTNAFEFEAVVDLATNLSALAGNVTIPNSVPQALSTRNDRDFGYLFPTNSFSNLAALFPGGNYSFIVSNLPSISIALPVGIAIANPPTLTNFTAAQSINVSNDFMLYWSPFQGGTTSDFIDVTLNDEFSGTVLKSGDYGCPGALDGTVTSFLIPANTLVTNDIYSLKIGFVKVGEVETNTIPGDILEAGTEADTTITISPAVPHAAPLILTNVAVSANGSIQFDLATTPGTTYTIEFNGNLDNPAGWVSLLVTNAVSTSLSFSNTPNGTNAGFYRATHN